MNILILYALPEKKTRQTIVDSFRCFSKYDKKNNYYFLNIIDIGCVKKLIRKRSVIGLSAVIVHYSAIAQRFDTMWWKKNKQFIFALLKQCDCTKILIPQDEYNYTDCVREFIKKAKIDQIYTCAYENDYERLYPKDLGYSKIETVFTGYIDEAALEIIEKTGYDGKRDIDIGYRARRGAYWLGSHGQLKYKLVQFFTEYLKNQQDITYDIANTKEDNTNVFLGDAWLKYLLRCRTVLGCLGGSGLLDHDGSIARNVDAYCMNHPNASFEEAEEACFKGRDNEIHLFALSPRHFEAAMTKTCQVLVEGYYGGVLEANVDYIEIKKDFSNIAEVVDKIRDKEYCRKIADNCYKHVVLSGKYTYAKFVSYIVGNITHDGSSSCFSWELYKTCKLSNYRVYHGTTIKKYLINIKQIALPNISNYRAYHGTTIKKYLINIKQRVLFNISNLIKTCISFLLGKVFLILQPFRNTKWHRYLKKKWDLFLKRRDEKL